MSESRNSDEDVFELTEADESQVVVSSSQTKVLSDSVTNLRRRKPPFGEIEVPEYNPNSGRPTLNPLLNTPVAKEQAWEQLQDSLSEDEKLRLLAESDSYGSESTSEGDEEEEEDGEEEGEVEEEEEEEEEDQSDDSVAEVEDSFLGLVYKAARFALPYIYMIFISLSLAYFLYLIDSQQREIHGLQSRISSLEQACSRKRADNARIHKY